MEPKVRSASPKFVLQILLGAVTDVIGAGKRSCPKRVPRDASQTAAVGAATLTGG
ncbi:MAG TPA: hypothetical protein VF986_05940 [Actinomycetota bacterium]